VYTPPLLARWVASLLLAELEPSSEPLQVLDPACGAGALLRAVMDQHPGEVRAQGLDRDPEALRSARAALGPGARLEQADALDWLAGRSRLPVQGLIANPPWGAELQQDARALRALGYSLARGQFDSADLFAEGSLAATAPGTVVALLLPDSIFLPEHQGLRRLVLEHSSLILAARLGEGFFPGVFRGAAVLLLRRGAAPAGHLVSCLRIPRPWRQRILAGEVTLAQANAALAHAVPQARFAADPQARFDIDQRRQDEGAVLHLERRTMPWQRWLTSGRGVEISRSGRIMRCPGCAHARPWPRSPRAECRSCGARIVLAKLPQERIVRPLQGTPPDGWAPLITGQDVGRHRCNPGHRIRLAVPGISYKPQAWYQGPKLLLRKTGVGIKAAVDPSGAHTTQVVYHFRPRPDAPPFLLDYLQGVLCSRALLAWHLVRRGENEWRSHPYLTQQLIQGFPIPDLHPGGWRWAQARAIAAAVQRRRQATEHDGPEDLAIERLVAGLFELRAEHQAWMLQILVRAQQLEPIRSLQLADPAAIRPRRVED